MKTILIGAGSDLGVHVDGAKLGPRRLITDLTSFYEKESVIIEQDPSIIKSRSLADKRKNDIEIVKFNKNLYDIELQYLEDGYFPITIGGDSSIAVASILASAKKHENIGLIWFSGHSNYDTLETTPDGNIHNLSLAAVNGYKCQDLRIYHSGNSVLSRNTVIIGASDISPKQRDNLKYSGVTVFTLDDIKTSGIENIINQAFLIASEKTNGVHISFDLSLLAPDVAPGISLLGNNGISAEDTIITVDCILKNIEKVTSFDLLEFNPTYDQNRKTEQIAVNILAKVIMSCDKK